MSHYWTKKQAQFVFNWNYSHSNCDWESEWGRMERRVLFNCWISHESSHHMEIRVNLKIEKTLAQIWVLQEATSLSWTRLHIYSEFISYPWIASNNLSRNRIFSNFNAFAILPSEMCVFMYYVTSFQYHSLVEVSIAMNGAERKDILHAEGKRSFILTSRYIKQLLETSNE